MKVSATFDRNVFVNCPFDSDYKPLLRAALFTVIYLGYEPRLSSERSDSYENRLGKICDLITDSRYSIHDISRLRANRKGDFARMNMPFELGIDYGCRLYGSKALKGKQCLILEQEQHDFKKAISDLSGVDIKSHNNEPDEIVRSVRNWFYETVGLIDIDEPLYIWYQFTEFETYLFESKLRNGLPQSSVVKDLEKMPVKQYVHEITQWVNDVMDQS